jgi:hypothetical protein
VSESIATGSLIVTSPSSSVRTRASVARNGPATLAPYTASTFDA